MKAARLIAFREPLRVEDIPVPEPGPGDALVRVTAVGVCRSDWHRWNDDLAWIGVKPQLPMTLGHEIGGVIESVGEGVRLAPGTRVTVPFVQSCGECENCTTGRDNLCPKGQVAGFARDGGFAEYVLVRVADLNCVPLPDAISDEVAAALGCRFPDGLPCDRAPLGDARGRLDCDLRRGRRRIIGDPNRRRAGRARDRDRHRRGEARTRAASRRT